MPLGPDVKLRVYLDVADPVTRRRLAALVKADPEWFFAFVPRDLAGGRDPTASVEMFDPAAGVFNGAFGVTQARSSTTAGTNDTPSQPTKVEPAAA